MRFEPTRKRSVKADRSLHRGKGAKVGLGENGRVSEMASPLLALRTDDRSKRSARFELGGLGTKQIREDRLARDEKPKRQRQRSLRGRRKIILRTALGRQGRGKEPGDDRLGSR
ncbi:MAG: hypothetical protein EBV06_14835 [Planctomycetia bacterium]|nr:hypothetical protein [Planctomycetia bacterium]